MLTRLVILIFSCAFLRKLWFEIENSQSVMHPKPKNVRFEEMANISRKSRKMKHPN